MAGVEVLVVKATDEDEKKDDVDENTEVGDWENVEAVLLVSSNDEEEVGKELVKVEKVEVGELVGTGHCKHVISIQIWNPQTSCVRHCRRQKDTTSTRLNWGFGPGIQLD